VPPQKCKTGNDAMTNAPWVVCSADANQAWISANNQGQYYAVQICQSLGYNSVSVWGGTCGNVCGYCQGATSCNAPGSMTFDGGAYVNGNCGNGITCNTVMWLCKK